MQDFIELAERLADASAAVIKSYHRRQMSVEDKADGSPVTIADREAETAMRALIRETFPAHGIIGEEFENHQPDAPYQWTLDPIDGTKNFVAGSFLFGTLIGLLKDNIPVMGLLNHPVTGHRLVGAAGETRLNGEVVRVRPCASIEDALLLTSTHTSVERFQDAAPFEALIRRARVYRTWGDAHGYFLLATGFADIILDPAMKLWDVAPLVPIVEGAGGTITTWQGGPIFDGTLPAQTSCIATAGPLHETVVTALNPT